ncbi:MAG TPA: gliding motility-associated C-terminal domain-containing protein, partial [Prolixibacteraceae bacterium]
DDGDQWLTVYEDWNGDGIYWNDDSNHNGVPDYLDPLSDCVLFIPDAFSPNGDNIHDYFMIYCLQNYPNAKMYIFDQLGNKLYEKNNYGNLDIWKTPDQAWWDGRTTNRSVATNNGMVIPGTYFYVLQLGNGEVKKSYVFISY